MRSLRRGLVCVLLCIAAPNLAAAQPKGRDKAPAHAEPIDVDVAEQQYGKLEYDKANETAERILKQRNLSHDQLVRATKVLAVTHAILGQEDQAREAFLRLLVFEPDYTVDTNLGPKVSTPFVEARGQFRSLTAKPGVEVAANVREGGGSLRVTTRDPTRLVKKVTVGHRWTSAGDYTVTTVPVGEATVEVAAAPQGRTRLDYFAMALDERDNVVFEAGNSQLPKSTFADAGARPAATPTPAKPGAEGGGSVFSSPLFWILAGAAVVGGGTAAYFAFRPDDPTTRAALSPQIRCGADLCK